MTDFPKFIAMNEKGLERARATGKLALEGKISLYRSEKFLLRNNNRTLEQQIEYVHRVLETYKQQGIPVERGSISNAFGCNFQGDIPILKVVAMVGQIYDIANGHGLNIKELTLADTMAWATPLHIKRMIGAIREKMIECARLAEEIVGHPLPGSVMTAGSLKRLREAARQAQ